MFVPVLWGGEAGANRPKGGRPCIRDFVIKPPESRRNGSWVVSLEDATKRT